MKLSVPLDDFLAHLLAHFAGLEQTPPADVAPIADMGLKTTTNDPLFSVVFIALHVVPSAGAAGGCGGG